MITFEAERGYRNALCNKMRYYYLFVCDYMHLSRCYCEIDCFDGFRFKNFLFPRVSKLCSQSKHKIAEKLLVKADRYDAARVTDRSKLLNKVCDRLCYSS